MAKTPSLSSITDTAAASAAALTPEHIPSPLLALVGATDATAEVTASAAKVLSAKVAELAAGDRFTSADAKQALDQARTTVKSIDVRNLDINVNLPAVDTSSWHKPELSSVAARALELAAKVEKKYDDLVVRGEHRVSELRGTASDEIAEAKPAATHKPSTTKATKPVKKAAPKQHPKTDSDGSAQ